jgi:hypothetical protein
MTLAHVHLDRVATPWLIRRFVDPDAEFSFLPWDARPPSGAEDLILFGMPDVELSSHDEAGTTFAKVLRAYELEDPALHGVERVVAAGVRHARGHEPAEDETREESVLGAALDRLGHGLALAYEDAEHVERAMAVCEGVYALCQVDALPEETRLRAPQVHPARIAYLRDAVGRSPS